MSSVQNVHRHEQDALLRRLGLAEKNLTEVELVETLSKLTNGPGGPDGPEALKEEVECSLCLCPIEGEEPFSPCDCSFFKIHMECLNYQPYRCKRCHVTYGRRVLMDNEIKCIALTGSNRRCRNKKAVESDLCPCHDRLRRLGRVLQTFTFSYVS